MTSGAFVDKAQIHVKAGNGGAGCVSFRREAHVSKGGPDGGDGGKGGDIWLVADRNISSLVAFKDHPHRESTSGKHGSGKNRHGSSGTDIEVLVPEGTVVKERSGKIIADLPLAGSRWLAAHGGRGGRGNARFLSNSRRAPSFAEQGEVGEEEYYNLELKLMADVAIVGFPNAGKSTLISRLSAAKPKVADYAFTTLQPHLGVVRFDDHDYTVADIPGLIEGASEGKGLGLEFLRHVERARVLLVLIDLCSIERSPNEQVDVLLHELGSYSPSLIERPRLVVGSRSDAAGPDVDWSGPTISAVTGDNVRWLMGELGRLVDDERLNQAEASTFVVHRPEPEGVQVTRLPDGSLSVEGRDVARAVALNDLTNFEALEYVHMRLSSMGVHRALAAAGAQEGDTVRIGDLVFAYEPDA
jgi:GTPase